MYELRRDACEALLARNSIGRLGCYSPADQQVYVVPVSYDYHDGAIFFSSINGEKVEYLRAHPQGICFEVDEVDDALNWVSVIVRGDFDELKGKERQAEKTAALRRAERGPMHWIFDSDLPARAKNALVIGAIRVRDMSGRRERWTWERSTPLPLSFSQRR
jgi:nitroimidazol reductase NimA-like FMN-containing flavoprotein (pyridoxamine 5'-phosphate oxidase superfamily)